MPRGHCRHFSVHSPRPSWKVTITGSCLMQSQLLPPLCPYSTQSSYGIYLLLYCDYSLLFKLGSSQKQRTCLSHCYVSSPYHSVWHAVGTQSLLLTTIFSVGSEYRNYAWLVGTAAIQRLKLFETSSTHPPPPRFSFSTTSIQKVSLSLTLIHHLVQSSKSAKTPREWSKAPGILSCIIVNPIRGYDAVGEKFRSLWVLYKGLMYQ